LAMATLVAGNEKGNDKNGYGQWLQQRGRQAFDGGNNGDDAKDTAACTTTGERVMMVVTGHGLCVWFGMCGETTKNKEECYLELLGSPSLRECVIFWQRGFLKARYC
jgi:hypothetical protein